MPDPQSTSLEIAAEDVDLRDDCLLSRLANAVWVTGLDRDALRGAVHRDTDSGPADWECSELPAVELDHKFRWPLHHYLALSIKLDAGDAGRPVELNRIERVRFAAFAGLAAILRAHRAADAILLTEIVDEDPLGLTHLG